MSIKEQKADKFLSKRSTNGVKDIPATLRRGLRMNNTQRRFALTISTVLAISSMLHGSNCSPFSSSGRRIILQGSRLVLTSMAKRPSRSLPFLFSSLWKWNCRWATMSFRTTACSSALILALRLTASLLSPANSLFAALESVHCSSTFFDA